MDIVAEVPAEGFDGLQNRLHGCIFGFKAAYNIR